MQDVEVYNNGILYCSVCAPKDMPVEDVVRRVNEVNTAGTMQGWGLDDSGQWASGAPMLSPCTDKPDTHTHYLMAC